MLNTYDLFVTRVVHGKLPIQIDLHKKINTGESSEIVVKIDGMSFQQNEFNLLMQLSQIIQDSGSVGEFQIGNLYLNINKMNEYQTELVKL